MKFRNRPEWVASHFWAGIVWCRSLDLPDDRLLSLMLWRDRWAGGKPYPPKESPDETPGHATMERRSGCLDRFRIPLRHHNSDHRNGGRTDLAARVHRQRD